MGEVIAGSCLSEVLIVSSIPSAVVEFDLC